MIGAPPCTTVHHGAPISTDEHRQDKMHGALVALFATGEKNAISCIAKMKKGDAYNRHLVKCAAETVKSCEPQKKQGFILRFKRGKRCARCNCIKRY